MIKNSETLLTTNFSLKLSDYFLIHAEFARLWIYFHQCAKILLKLKFSIKTTKPSLINIHQFPVIFMSEKFSIYFSPNFSFYSSIFLLNIDFFILASFTFSFCLHVSCFVLKTVLYQRHIFGSCYSNYGGNCEMCVFY